ncbi:uncharacterized protein LOC111708640 [Eurytemora carolleeae]|uniref:uncharacterized protein LOC111708640 n=1 Tax=Eurytemora carolleeae TaxID=1294199 RepID=UPI000C793081|nr:uncharacterized protein LOC111708640 [Eurytemora carolleeae]|eukprot:XP_023337849.1 uncharacterized protein LOC111708640 [Eurytemora affinis]
MKPLESWLIRLTCFIVLNSVMGSQEDIYTRIERGQLNSIRMKKATGVELQPYISEVQEVQRPKKWLRGYLRLRQREDGMEKFVRSLSIKLSGILTKDQLMVCLQSWNCDEVINEMYDYIPNYNKNNMDDVAISM